MAGGLLRQIDRLIDVERPSSKARKEVEQGLDARGWASAAAAMLYLAAIETQAAKATYRGDPEYLIDSWEIEDGLPENSATAMAPELTIGLNGRLFA